MVLVSDRRILFVARGEETESPAGTHSLAYGDLAGVDNRGEQLALQTTDGVTWRIPLPSEASEALETALAHLSWVGELRGRLLGCRNDVELATGEIREHTHALDWGRAESSYEEVRDRLDRLICDVQLVEPVGSGHLAPELTDIEHQLERAHTRLYIERAKEALAIGRNLIETGEYERAGERLRSAHRFYDLASAQNNAVTGSDGFQFGAQRALQDDIENLGWEMEAVAAEPVRQAHEAKLEAQLADDPPESLDRWESVFRQYGHVLALRGGEDRSFAGDPAEIRREREDAVGRIVGLRQERARDEWNAGARRYETGDTVAALDHCTNAVDHLERALELCEQFDPGDPAAIEGRLAGMRRIVDALREHAADAHDDPGGPQDPERSGQGSPGLVGSYEEVRAGDGDPGPAASEGEHPATTPSVDELTSMDVHHEITLEAEHGQFGSAGDNVTEVSDSTTGDGDVEGNNPEETASPDHEQSESALRR